MQIPVDQCLRIVHEAGLQLGSRQLQGRIPIQLLLQPIFVRGEGLVGSPGIGVGLGGNQPLGNVTHGGVDVILNQRLLFLGIQAQVRGGNQSVRQELPHVFCQGRIGLMVHKGVAQILVIAHILHDHAAHNRVIQINHRNVIGRQLVLQLENLSLNSISIRVGTVTGGADEFIGLLDDDRFSGFVFCPEHIVDVAVADFRNLQRAFSEIIRKFGADIRLHVPFGQAEVLSILFHNEPPISLPCWRCRQKSVPQPAPDP